ncbi:Hypothetical protein CINCED_3A023356, partial [Cinara cedri]
LAFSSVIGVECNNEANSILAYFDFAVRMHIVLHRKADAEIMVSRKGEMVLKRKQELLHHLREFTIFRQKI